MSTTYDDLLPLSLYKSELARYLLDRHNDVVATFDPSVEDHECQRILVGANVLDEARAALEAIVKAFPKFSQKESTIGGKTNLRYWSPTAAMVDTQLIANAAAVLAKMTPPQEEPCR